MGRGQFINDDIARFAAAETRQALAEVQRLRQGPPPMLFT